MNRTEEVVVERLAALCESAGYGAYKMRKFEEYSLYLENKNFLSSEYVITFNDLNGKLLALKPDVTLSIVKNTKATLASSEKLYYQESVFRLEKQTHEYKEINQFGLETLGHLDGAAELEICLLALRSLETVGDEFVLDVSHMGFVTGLLEAVGVSGGEVLECIRSKNSHDLVRIALASGLKEEAAEKLKALTELGGNWENALRVAEKLILNDTMRAAFEELKSVLTGIPEAYQKHVRLDFSIVNDTDYYNGILFRGYLKKLHRAVLSGGRYDLLCERFGKNLNAMGFAMYLNDLVYYDEKREFDTDVLLLYPADSTPGAVLQQAEALRKTGKSVRVERTIPENVKYRELMEL